MLSAEQFASILKSAGPDEAKPEHRQARRVPHRGDIMVTLNPGAGAPPQTVAVKDLSARGVGIVCPVEVARGGTFLAHLPRRAAGTLTVLCTVAHCQSLSDGLFAIGAEFTCVVSEPAPVAVRDAEVDRIRQAILKTCWD